MLPSSSTEVAAKPQDEFDLDIGVIYTHERNYIAPLLDSLSRSGDGLKMRLILVDNNSQEGVGEWIDMFEHTTVVRNDRRLGYASNLNRILKSSNARYVLLLNTDMVFEPEEQCLAKMVSALDRDPQCGLAGCRLYHPDGTYGFPARRFPRLTTILARRFSRVFRAPQSIRDYLYEEHDREETFTCDWLSGCFLMLRRACHRQVGGFDEGFRKYFEDVDYCGRVARANWNVKFHGHTHCFHWEQRDSAQVFSRDSWLHIASYARWLAKRSLGYYAGAAEKPQEVKQGDLNPTPAGEPRTAPVSGPHRPQSDAMKSSSSQRQADT